MIRAAFTVWLLTAATMSAATVALTRSDGAAAQLPVPPPPVPVPSPAPPAVTPQTVLKVGDTIRIDGTAIGCQVTRRGGRTVVECRRDGSVSGTYGTFMSDRTVTVARFRSRRTAQTILTARHGGGWRACDGSARRSRVVAISKKCR
jgi:hypothetical protein